MHPLITAQHSAIANICRRYQVRRLEVFGSAARGTDFDPERSDAMRISSSSSRPMPKPIWVAGSASEPNWSGCSGGVSIWLSIRPCATPMCAPTSNALGSWSMPRELESCVWDCLIVVQEVAR